MADFVTSQRVEIDAGIFWSIAACVWCWIEKPRPIPGEEHGCCPWFNGKAISTGFELRGQSRRKACWPGWAAGECRSVGADLLYQCSHRYDAGQNEQVINRSLDCGAHRGF